MGYRAYLDEVGVPHIVTGRNRADVGQALEVLAVEHDVRHVRVDSGGTLNGILLRQGLVDEVSVLLEPRLVGGRSARSMVVAPDLTSIDDVVPLELLDVEALADGFVWLRYSVRH